MANPEHVAIIDKGVATWNQWKETNRSLRADLRAANLSGRDFSRIDFSEVDLTAANLSESTLWNADMRGVVLNRAVLERADLEAADFAHIGIAAAAFQVANLEQANLKGARLFGTTFDNAILRAADFDGALLGWTSFLDNDLSLSKNLEAVKHSGPSSIGIETLRKSNGNIPQVFLRGCGVPEPFIINLKALTGAIDPIQFYSCFISYSTKDQEFASRLHADLQDKGVRCWFAPHDIAGGKKIHEQIDEAIRVYDRLLLILSDHSMSSEWVKTEIANARQRELNEKRQMLFPISLAPFENLRQWRAFDADTGKDSAREIREYFIPDFSRWKEHDSYQEAFERLLRDLRADGTTAQKA
jgi:hypothetical protein